MARFINALLLCGSVAVAASAIAHGNSDDLATLPVINGHVTPGQFRALSSSLSLKSCIAPQCKALQSLVLSYDRLRRFYTPNTMARSDNPPSLVRPRLPVQEKISDDVGQRPAIANDLVIIARDVPEWSTEMLTIEITTLTDASGQTVRRVIEAIPKTPALAGVVKAARARCDMIGEEGCKAIYTAE